MAKLETELKWRKKTIFSYRDEEIEDKFIRYVLVCGMILFVRQRENLSLGMNYSSNPVVISEKEFPEKHALLEAEYVKAVIDEPLSEQDVRFVR